MLPEWQKIDSLETYFAKERRDYLKATEKGPNDPRTGRPMWNLDEEEKPAPGERTAICLAYGIC